MEKKKALLDLLKSRWLGRYGYQHPQWIDCLEDLEDISKATISCKKRILAMSLRLQEEQALLQLLLQEGDTSGPDYQTFQEAAKTPPCRTQCSTEEKRDYLTFDKHEIPFLCDNSTSSPPVSRRRRRALEQVGESHEKLARRVKEKVKEKHWSISGIESVFDLVEHKEQTTSNQVFREEEKPINSCSIQKKSLVRLRSRSESSVCSQTEREVHKVHTNTPIVESRFCQPLPVKVKTPQVDFNSSVTDCLSVNKPMDVPGRETKRLSNGSGLHVSDEDENDFVSSVKTIVGEDIIIPLRVSAFSEVDPTVTLKRELFLEQSTTSSGSGDKTPTDILIDASIKEEPTLDTLCLIKAGEIYHHEQERSFDAEEEEDDDDDEKQSEDTGSINEMETSGYHNTFQNLAESTLTYILRDTIFASRSNSMSSLNDSRRSLSPEPSTPLGGVSLRPNSGRIKERNRAAQVLENTLNDEGIDEERLHMMLLEIQDSSSPCQSPSPVSSSYSDPSSPTHLVPYDHHIHQPLSARSSRMYPIRRDTVVVHGEVLVIRKLVVVGIVTAEKAYMDCLNVAKEYYRKPLLALTSTSQPIVTERDVNTIFYRVEDLYALHSSLHEKLEALLPDWGMHSCVGDFFLELCKNLKLYKDYVEMYRRSLECLEHSKQDPNFKKFLDDVRSTVSSQFKDVPNVNELLRKPIERLQSYSLVLTDLCQHTPETHNDFSVLKQSLNVMSDFIASTHDPRAFQQLSGGFNRELVKQELVVELMERSRKIRRLFLFHDVLVSAKEKSPRHGEGVKLEPKWYLPLQNLMFRSPEAEALRPVPVTSDQELSVIKSRIAELKAHLNRDNKERRSSTLDKDASFKRNFKFIGTKPEKLRKKLQEQQVAYWVASPSLPLRLYGSNGKRYVFLLHNEDERESWISAIKKLQPKAVQSVSLSQYELQDLLSRQKVHLTRDQDEVIEVHTDEDEYLSGIIRVHVTSAKDLKTKLNYGLHCGLEFDEYSRFDRKARTLPVNMDLTTLMVTWDQDFEIEIVGAHMMKVMIFYKYLLKEEICAVGKLKLPIKDLKSSKRCKVEIPLHPQGVVTIVIEYFTSMASMGKRPALLSSGVFGFPMDTVAKRERHNIPLIVQTCVDEVERRGLSEVGIYRVAGVLRDVQELRMAFDSDYIHAQQIAFETDIHAVAGLLKRYFRELPDPLFTDELYLSFVQALALADPEAREQSLITLLHSLPTVNFKTAVFLFKHLRNVAAESEVNKMTLNNLATIFGPNLLRPGGNQSAPFDVMSPVNVLMFFLVCPLEVFDDPSSSGSAPSSASKGSKKRHELPSPLTGDNDESVSIVSSQSTGFATTNDSATFPVSSPSDTILSSTNTESCTSTETVPTVSSPTASTPDVSMSNVPTPSVSTSTVSSPTVSTPTVSTPTSSIPTSSTPTSSTPVRFKQSVV